MYNRYIPQPDGSYHRQSATDTYGTIPLDGKAPAPPPPKEIPEEHPKHRPPDPHPPEKCPTGGSIGDFFKKLLPQSLDTGDLLAILLLLLMAGEEEQDSTTTLLTLALYLLL
jgi:hypothetical protein